MLRTVIWIVPCIPNEGTKSYAVKPEAFHQNCFKFGRQWKILQLLLLKVIMDYLQHIDFGIKIVDFTFKFQ